MTATSPQQAAVAAVLRDGTRECAVRLRSHDAEADDRGGPGAVIDRALD